MDHLTNAGFDPRKIDEVRNKIESSGNNFIPVNEDDNSDEYVNFYFIGMFEGKEVIYDAVMYTLRLHHNSELYEIAEHRAAKRFPEFKSIQYQEDENGDLETLNDKQEEIGLFMAETIMELEEEAEVRVKEHVELDTHIDFGVGLDVTLNIEQITPEAISNFVTKYNEDAVILDETLYTFETEDYEL